MKNQTKNVKLAAIVVAVLIVIIFAAILIKKYSSSDRGRAVAVVNGITVYEGDLQDRLQTLTSDRSIKVETLPENILRAMVLEVIVNHKIDAEAKKLKYDNDEQIKQLVSNYKRGLMREKYLNDNIYSKITDDDALKEYEKLVTNLKGKEERKVKHILVENEDEIERVRRNVMRTGNFEKIAREKSIDTASGENGGDIGYVLREELVPEFGDVAFLIKVGEISKPVKTQFGWHIIKVEDVRPAQFLPFEQVRDSIKQRLQQQAIQDYLMSLTKDADVEFKINVKSDSNIGNMNNNTTMGTIIEENITQEEFVME